MATSGPTNLPAFFNTDADFRSYCAGINAALAAVGLTQTADTGQINNATVTKPGAINTSQGYEIWRFSDALQATAPCFIKLEYGSGATSAGRPAIWMTVGSATDGAGTVTGQVGTRTQLVSNVTKAAASVLPLYVCGANDRLYMAVNIDLGQAAATNSIQNGFFAAVERTKDGTGANTSDAIHTFYSCSTSSSTDSIVQVIPPSGAVPSQLTAPCTFTANYWASSSAGGAALIVPVFVPYNGKWLSTLVCAANNTDFGIGGTFTATVMGATHTFMFLAQATMQTNFAFDGPAGKVTATTHNGLCMPWE